MRYGSHGEEDADIEFYRQDAKNGHENAEHFQAERDIARAEVERLKKLVDDLHVQGYKDRDEASAELAALTIENERLKKIETEYAEFAKAIDELHLREEERESKLEAKLEKALQLGDNLLRIADDPFYSGVISAWRKFREENR